eukprot:CAMPEP_0201521946 /NCGR_PEP_ID=MMETSP0161_2-20130828/16366_1 /ASSEMBLY_ACC=CAM_ASM_000251 /TAXON_ID=180227 /ORGANISM="Neoparamoeba aestuarina, Strain SoJaBio B1-5/56/2" /LENGTH=490 /DNA_ID=CAMNT_0047920687 /DNA_START=223 /DNA_END=1695 /DNA_ORIENTATION=-
MSLALKIQYEGQNRRIRIPAKDGEFTIKDVNQAVAGVFKSFEGRTFTLSYVDDEGDEAQIASDMELQEALVCAGAKNNDTGDWQLKLKVKVHGDQPACLQSIIGAPEEEKKEEKEKEEEEKSLLDYTSPSINTVPLTDLFDEQVISHPFFVQMREDFVNFAHNVRDSVPKDFPEKAAAQMEAGFETIRKPIVDFAAEVQKNHKEIRVPTEWKENPLIVQLSDSLRNGREEMKARMERWNETQARLVEMGFDSLFIQRVLIMIHDGDLRKVLDDLLMRQGQNERIENTFQNLSTSIVALFKNLDAQGFAFYQRSSSCLQALPGHIQSGASSSAQFIQTQIDANSENISFLQTELDRNVRALQTTLARLNDAGAKGMEHGLAHGANFFTLLLENIQNAQKQLEVAREAREAAEKERQEKEAKEEKKEESAVVMDEIPQEDEKKDEVKEEEKKDPRLDESLKLLQDMGFVDIGKCTDLLIQSNFDMEAVLDQM